ncbi:MAG: response regulator [Deltaproteobacteria bacterium]|nr:response regulator [Deltaproteobacteria bacterium]
MSEKRVLVVDDDADLREVIVLALRDALIEVDEAPDGLRALDLLAAGLRPSLILVDLVMPVLDGRAFIRKLANLGPQMAQTPVLVLTASARPVLPGDVPVLGKPFDAFELVRRVRQLLEQPQAVAC